MIMLAQIQSSLNILESGIKELFLNLKIKENEDNIYHELMLKLADEVKDIHTSVSELSLAVEDMRQFLLESTQKQNLNKEKNHDKR